MNSAFPYLGLTLRSLLFIATIAASGAAAAQAPMPGNEFGKFLDELNVSLSPAGYKMTLLNDYRFEDPTGEIWLAKKGSTVDGASIPQVFWSVVGAPLDGLFRNASVIHDYYCVTRVKDWQETHKVFYYGMRSAGVTPVKALAMYYAVLAFGPRWGRQARNTAVCKETDGKVSCDIVTVNDVERVDIPTTQEDAEDVRNFERALQGGAQLSVSDLERMALSKGNPRFPRELRR